MVLIVRKSSLKHNKQDATFSRSIYFYKLLYMFQAIPPFIIRAQNCTYSVRYCQNNTAAIVDEMELASSISSTIAAAATVLV